MSYMAAGMGNSVSESERLADNANVEWEVLSAQTINTSRCALYRLTSDRVAKLLESYKKSGDEASTKVDVVYVVRDKETLQCMEKAIERGLSEANSMGLKTHVVRRLDQDESDPRVTMLEIWVSPSRTSSEHHRQDHGRCHLENSKRPSSSVGRIHAFRALWLFLKRMFHGVAA